MCGKNENGKGGVVKDVRYLLQTFAFRKSAVGSADGKQGELHSQKNDEKTSQNEGRHAFQDNGGNQDMPFGFPSVRTESREGRPQKSISEERLS